MFGVPNSWVVSLHTTEQKENVEEFFGGAGENDEGGHQACSPRDGAEQLLDLLLYNLL